MQIQNAKNGDGASTASYRIIKIFPHFQLWHFNAFDLSTRLNKSINEHEKVCIFWTKPNLVLLSVIATLDLKYALKRTKLDERKLHIVYYEKTCSKKCIDRSDSLSMDVFIAYGEKTGMVSLMRIFVEYKTQHPCSVQCTQSFSDFKDAIKKQLKSKNFSTQTFAWWMKQKALEIGTKDSKCMSQEYVFFPSMCNFLTLVLMFSGYVADVTQDLGKTSVGQPKY